MKQASTTAQLHMNETLVGEIDVRGWEGAWGFGEFRPGPGFAPFAPLYGRWSLLMHADDDADKIDPATAEELREVEQAQYKIHAKLHLPGTGEWRNISLIIIDGPLIEWKEQFVVPTPKAATP
jgi:hypothetical protein